MRILIAASEAVPFIKTGGLADVTGALFKEYGKMKEEACLMLPLYRAIKENFDPADTGLKVSIPVGDRLFDSRVFSYGKGVFFVECDEFFDRPDIYGTPEGDYADNASRFIFFCRAILELCRALNFRPDVIHCNDWQTGLVPLYLRTFNGKEFFSRTAAVMTIHNIGYQGIFDAADFRLTGLGLELFNPEGVEFYGKVNFLKAGITASDIITTVSSTYAKEILTGEYGYGLDGVLKKHSSRLYGVTNGIDTEEWNPLRDEHIPQTYGVKDLSGKAVCRRELIKECSLQLKDQASPIIAVVGRLSEQKGFDLLIDSADDIVSMGVNLVILGKGDEHFHALVAGLSERHKGRVYARIGYDEAFAHRIYAGSDMFIMPSRYEPCGLSQLISMRYGTIPIARRTGGLADTITDYEPLNGYGTGFLFNGYNADSLKECVKRALCVYADRRQWKKVMSSAMKKDFSWENSAGKYIELYNEALKMRLAR